MLTDLHIRQSGSAFNTDNLSLRHAARDMPCPSASYLSRVTGGALSSIRVLPSALNSPDAHTGGDTHGMRGAGTLRGEACRLLSRPHPGCIDAATTPHRFRENACVAPDELIADPLGKGMLDPQNARHRPANSSKLRTATALSQGESSATRP